MVRTRQCLVNLRQYFLERTVSRSTVKFDLIVGMYTNLDHRAPKLRYRFGAFELTPDERSLRREQAEINLTPRAFDVLVALVARSGDLVTKRALLDAVWNGVMVEENNVQVQISALRKIVGSAGIATVQRYGYRFVLPVSAENG